MNFPPATQRPKPQFPKLAAICLGLALAVAVVFGQTAGFDFVNYDDDLYIYNNPMVTNGLTFKDVFWGLTEHTIDYWHPLTWLSHMADCQVFGLWAGGHHLTNVLLHALAAIFLFLALQEMTGALWRSASVAAIFAVHPLRAESVAWITERKDVLSGMFCMLTLWLYARYARHPSRGRYAGVVLVYGLGLLSKNMLITVPFILLLLDWWPLQRIQVPIARLIREKIPMLFLLAGSCVASALIPVMVGEIYRLPLLARLENSLVAYVIYPCHMIFPAHLAVPYLYPPHGHPWWKIMAAFLLLAAVSALAVVCRKKHQYLLVGWLWYLGTLLPVSGIMQISYYAGADRYNYLPGIGLLLAGTWAVADGSSGWKFRTVRLGVLMAAVMGILMACAWRQTSCWKNSETLWNHTLACDNNNYVAHNNLAYYLLDKGRLEEAFDHFHTAVELAPNNSDVHFGFAKVLREHGKLDEAIGQYEEAVRLTPSNSKAHNDLGTALRQKGRLDEAISQFQLAIKSDPGNESIDFNLARTFYQAGRTGDAISQYESALRLDPTDVEAQNNLAWILAAAPQVSLRDGAKAAQLAARANEQTGGKNPVILGTLAAAYAEAGRFAEAVKCAQTAIELAQSTGRSELAAKINRELQRYEEGQALPPTK